MAFGETLKKKLQEKPLIGINKPIGLNIPNVEGQGDFVKNIAQGSMRAYAGTGAGILNIGKRIQAALDPTETFEEKKRRAPSSVLTPTGPIQTAIYGTSRYPCLRVSGRL